MRFFIFYRTGILGRLLDGLRHLLVNAEFGPGISEIPRGFQFAAQANIAIETTLRMVRRMLCHMGRHPEAVQPVHTPPRAYVTDVDTPDDVAALQALAYPKVARC